MRKLAPLIALAAALTGVAAAAQAQSFPSRPITMIVSYPAGGPADTLARIMSERMKASLGQPVIVENIAGAGGTIGVGRVVHAPPDGTMISLGQWGSHVGSGAVYPVTYNVLTDMEPISLLTFAPLWVVGKNGLPAKDVTGLIAWLKANPDKASAATAGPGSGSHLCEVYFQEQTGTRFGFVPYRGGAPAMQDLTAGNIDLMCIDASNSLSQVRNGLFRAYAMMSKDRWFASPDVPTMNEMGYPGFNISVWSGLWAPKNTPKDILARLNAAVSDTLADPVVRKRLTDLGQVVATRDEQTPQALHAHHKAEIDKWWPIIKSAGIKAQ